MDEVEPDDGDHASVTTADRLTDRVVGCFMLTLGFLGATAGTFMTFLLATEWPEEGFPVKTAAVISVTAILMTTVTVLALWSGLGRLLIPTPETHCEGGPA